MIGSVVSHYRVIDRLGAGGMGVVYRAEDLRLGRHVAVKFLPDSATTDPLATERFHREARTTSALNHPNICTLHDVGEFEGRRFIVMELIDGATLDKVLGAGALPVDRVIDIAVNVADALDAAHTEGILHRDIKPGNIFITRRGQVKVVDFGLAKMMPQRGGLQPVDVTIADQHTLTSAGMAVGTVAYMSPEHARGEAIDQRSDLFSLGVVMYEMATGVQTFKGQTTAVIFDQILNRVPVPPSQINPDVIPTLEQIIGRLLEKDRDRRYQFARDVQADLQRLRRDLDAGRLLTAENAQTTVPHTWAPLENKRSAQTVAVNVPTFGVEADPSPVPAAWAPDWGQPRPSSKPDVQRSEAHIPADETLPDPAVPPPIERPPSSPSAAPIAAQVRSRAMGTATATADSGSAPTVMVPASGSHLVGTPTPPPVPVAEFENFAAYVPHAPDDDTARAAARRESSPATAPSGESAASVPAVWTTPAARAAAPRRTPSRRSFALVAAAVVTVGVVGGGLWWALQGREVPVSGTADAPAAAAPPVAPPDAPPPAAVTEATAAPATATTPAAKPSSPSSPTAKAVTPGAPATIPPATATATPAPAASRPPSKAIAAQAAALLTEAQALLQSGAEADGLNKIATLRASFGGTPAARDGAVLAARTYHAGQRYEQAAAAWLDAARDGVRPEDISEGLIQAADGAARQRTTDGDVLARRTLGDILDRYPASVRALRALQMKMSIEDRMKLKEPDAELNGTAPASLLTLRKAARASGTAPVAEFALWRLGQEYRERRLYDLAAAAFTDLGTRFPETRYDAWFSAAELFEKHLKDSARARDAYAKVPAASPRYEAAQKKLASA